MCGLGFISFGWLGCSGESAVIDAATDPWSGDFSYGPYAVGFRITELTRQGSEGPRTIELSAWYPAEAGPGGTEMRVADYFRTVLREGQLLETEGLSEAPGFVAAMTGTPSALSSERASAGLERTVGARLNAEAATGPFPVVLWSSRHATVLAQAPIAELLASHGFVVATAWSSDPPLAFLWEDRSSVDKLATIEAHTRDLVRALEELREDPTVDGENVVVMAWSYGGQTAARMQEREPAVRGVVALDANVLPAREEESLELRRPLIYVVGRDTSGRGFERLQRQTAPWVAVRFTELAHGNFNALEGYLPAVLGTDTVYGWSRGGPVARIGYRSLARLVASATQALVEADPLSTDHLASSLHEAVGSTPVEVFTPNR